MHTCIYLVQLCTIVCINLKTYKSIHCIARNVHVSLVTFIASNLLLGLSYCSHADAMRFYIRWCNFFSWVLYSHYWIHHEHNEHFLPYSIIHTHISPTHVQIQHLYWYCSMSNIQYNPQIHFGGGGEEVRRGGHVYSSGR